MSRLAIALLLAAFSANAAAEWVRVASFEKYIAYVDPTTISGSGTMVKMWSLLDYKTTQESPSGKVYLSGTILHEYDCQGERFRTLSYSLYTGPMGLGDAIFTDSGEGKWNPVHPETAGEYSWKFACGKK
ncbi:MAG TPA: surface-adhesin E family protein [Burkholderiales bacterium]|nr:surface-adhesin E family protein [Burkholderiales bacterium]